LVALGSGFQEIKSIGAIVVESYQRNNYEEPDLFNLVLATENSMRAYVLTGNNIQAQYIRFSADRAELGTPGQLAATVTDSQQQSERLSRNRSFARNLTDYSWTGLPPLPTTATCRRPPY